MIKQQKSHQPRVAIMIPTFNRDYYIKQAINSSLDQTHSCQIVVCDHGSIDNTPQVVKEYGDRIQYIRRDKDFGPHFCWLEGILHCEAEYVHIQHDDDWIAPTYIEECLSLFNDEVGCVFSKASVFFEKENRYQPHLNYPLETGIHDKALLEKILIQDRDMISPSALLIRKQDLIDALYQGRLPTVKAGGYHGVGPDFFMSLLTLLRYQKFGYVNKDLAFFRAHEGSITIDSQKDEEKGRLFAKAYEDVRDYYSILKEGLLSLEKKLQKEKMSKSNTKNRFIRFLKRSFKTREEK